MESKEQYRLADTEQAKRIAEFAEIDDPTNRRNEIAVCRTLIESSLQKGNTTVALSALSTLDRLQKNAFKQALIHHEILTRPCILRFARPLVDIIGEEIAVLPGYEDVLISISSRIDESLNELRNTDKEIQSVPLPR